MKDLHLGYDESEMGSSAYARFFNLQMAELPEHICNALLNGAVAHELMPPVDRARELQVEGYYPVENGYSIAPDGSARISVLTRMPGVTPAMWDWWFAWHGSEAQRYKLWHPRAHVHVVWEDGRDDLDNYVGRVSSVVEYIGSSRMNLNIRFVAPASVGFDEQLLVAKGETAICARVSIARIPIDTGWLVHQVRPVVGGSEMRSRFWIAGENIAPRGMSGRAGRVVGRVAARLNRQSATAAAELLTHCAQEMNHLANILPELYQTFNSN